MPIFQISEKNLIPIEQSNFQTEKALQALIELNLGSIFNCRFVASEFATGAQHAGRIDTLALSEDNNPVIIEYKKVESSELINQSLFYLYWIQDHRGDFEIAVQKHLGNKANVDWSDIRVICIAPNYKKYDIHAVQVIGANIELWKYRLFNNATLYLEEVFQRSYSTAPALDSNGKNPVMVAAGRKAALTKATMTYTFTGYLKGKPERIKTLVQMIQEYMMNLDPGMEEAPKKTYIAYRTTQNIVCVEAQRHKVLLYLKLNPKEAGELPSNARDVSDIGHNGTGDLGLIIESEKDLETAKPFIEMAYQKVGG